MGTASAQWGPGGVGNTAGTLQGSILAQPAIRGWYTADLCSTMTSSTAVERWRDRSRRNIYADAPADPAQKPALIANAANGRPAVRFSGAGNACLTSRLMASTPSSQLTVMAVARNVATSNAIGGIVAYNGFQGMFAAYTAGPPSNLQFTMDGNGASPANAASTQRAVGTGFRILTGMYGSAANMLNSRMFMDGTLEKVQNPAASPNPAMLAYTQMQLGGRTWGNQPNRIFAGDIAEVIVFDQPIDSAQRIIVENYLAEKYGLTLRNRRFAFGNTSRFDLAGIGMAFNSSRHDSATSSLLTLAAPQALAPNRYMLFGHNNADAATLGTTETPGNDVTFVRRIAREWRFNKTGGDLGSTRLYVDFNGLNGSVPAGFTRGIFIDADGDFRTGATFVDLLPSQAGVYVTPRINIADGSFITLGCVKRVVSFVAPTSQGFEDQTEYPVLQARLNFPYPSTSNLDVVVDYTVEPYGTFQATGPCFDFNACDFNNGRSQLIISAGQQTVDLNQDAFDVDAALFVHNDTAAEPNAESIRLTLTNAINAGLGSQATHTYTIIDDDFFRKIGYVQGQNAYTWHELDAGQYKDTSFVISLPAGQTGGPSFVTVVGTGSAKAGKDYLLLDAAEPADSAVRLQIGDLDQTVRLRIRLLGEQVNENTESVTFTLTRPSSATLSGTAPITASITITDNDPLPQVSFNPVPRSGSESMGMLTVKVRLNVESGKLVTIPFFTSAGTATADGVDWDNISPSPVYIQPGDTIGTITLEIIDDRDEEDDETISISMGTPINAVAGTSPYTFTIIDNDVYGDTGPGGVDQLGNDGTLELWFAADESVTVSGGSTIARWANISGRSGRDALPVAGGSIPAPTLVNNALFGKPAVRFNNQVLTGTLTRPVPGSPLTIFAVARQNSAPATLSGQTLGAIFSTDRWAGISSYGTNYLAEGFTTSPTFVYPTATNTANTGWSNSDINSFQLLTAQYTQNNTQGSSLFANGALHETSTAAGVNIDVHSSFRMGVRHPNSSGFYFRGDVAEVIFFTSALNTTRRTLVENYLAAKYGLSISNNYFAGADTAFRYELAGIGTSDGTSNNKHRQAESGGLIVRQRNNSLNGTNEYLLFGRNSGNAGTTVVNISGGLSEVWTRAFYIKKTGAIDVRLTFDYDLAGITHNPLPEREYYLLFRSSAFSSWSKVAGVAPLLVGNQVSFDLDNSMLPNGYYTLGRTDPSILPVVFAGFDAYRKGGIVQLRWSTASETNSDRFEIERSSDGQAYTKIGQVQAAGHSAQRLNYDFADNKPLAGKAYYRLRQLDRDQTVTLSPIRVVSNQVGGAGFTQVKLYPNPVQGALTISLPAEVELQSAQVFDTKGMAMATTILTLSDGLPTLDMASLPKGYYLLHLKLSTGEVVVRHVVKQ